MASSLTSNQVRYTNCSYDTIQSEIFDNMLDSERRTLFLIRVSNLMEILWVGNSMMQLSGALFCLPRGCFKEMLTNVIGRWKFQRLKDVDKGYGNFFSR